MGARDDSRDTDTCTVTVFATGIDENAVKVPVQPQAGNKYAYTRRPGQQMPGGVVQPGMPVGMQGMPQMNGLGQMGGQGIPPMPNMPNMPQPMYGAQSGTGYTPGVAPAMGGTIGAAGGVGTLTGTLPTQGTAGQTGQPAIPTPSAPTQRSVSSLSGISRPSAPLESKVEAKAIKIPDFLRNNK